MSLYISIAGIVAIGAVLIGVGLSIDKVALCLFFLLFLYVVKRVRFIAQDEQLFVEKLTKKEVINGPKITTLPLLMKSAVTRKALSLGPLEYCVVKDDLSGEERVEEGPRLLMLGAYDIVLGGKRQVISLKATEFVKLIDRATGSIRVELGEQGRVVPTVYEIVDGGVRQAIALKCFEYVKIADKKSGEVRVEKGEKLVFLGPFEQLLGNKQQAVEVDDETAVLVRNKRSGQQHLIQEKQLYFPTADEEILEARKLIKLADHESCIVRGKDGKDTFMFGHNDQQRSFFLPPHSSLVEMHWSRGRRREKRDLHITKFDLRPFFMSFEFNCRTADNVELILEGSFFWQIANLQDMAKSTSDTTGDICNHARSGFIERVSKVTLQTFMNDFNKIAEQVHTADGNDFYSKRGVKIHSLEVTSYRCAEASTAETLRAIIKETTNRMNRMQKQHSENEVQLAVIMGDIEEEKARGALLDVQTQNKKKEAEMEGLGEAQHFGSFLRATAEDVPDLQTRVQAWKVLRKQDALHTLSNGTANAKLYFTPSDCNLAIENHEHEHSSSSNWEQVAKSKV